MQRKAKLSFEYLVTGFFSTFIHYFSNIPRCSPVNVITKMYVFYEIVNLTFRIWKQGTQYSYLNVFTDLKTHTVP